MFLRAATPLRTVSLLVYALAALILGAPGFAQTPPEPASPAPHSALAVSTSPADPTTPAAQIVPSGQMVSVTIPPGQPGKVRLTIADPGGAVLDEAKLTPQPGPDGTMAVSARLDADPGLYEASVLSADKTRQPLAPPVPVEVPGVVRHAGCWLFNGSPILVEGRDDDPANAGPAVCLSHLGYKDVSSLPVTVTRSAQPVFWRVLPLPPLSDMMAKGYDFAALEANLRAEFAAAHGVYVGWELPSRPEGYPAPLDAGVDGTVVRLRDVINLITPGAALILKVNEHLDYSGQFRVHPAIPELDAQDIDAAARYCDAVHLDYNAIFRELWPIKVARRNAEDRAKYDLPILVSLDEDDDAGTPADFARGQDLFLLSCLGSGASGLIVPRDAAMPVCRRLVGRNLNWWLDWVTLEDTPLLPCPGIDNAGLYQTLLRAGRMPLLGRLPAGKDGGAESLFAVLDNSTTADTLDSLKDAASRGGSIYLQGLPNLQDKSLLGRMEDLSGCKVTPLPQPVTTNLVLDDPWTFGDARGTSILVEQRVKLEPRPSTSTKKLAESDENTGPQFPAHLTGDPIGMVSSVLGKGRVLWMPQTFAQVETASRATPSQVTASQAMADLVAYYAAIAGSQAPALVQLTPGADSQVRFFLFLGLRRTPKGSLVLFAGPGWNNVWNVTIRTKSEYVYDLVNEREVASSLRGYSTSFTLTLPEAGSAVVALPANQADFVKERAETRLTAHLASETAAG